MHWSCPQGGTANFNLVQCAANWVNGGVRVHHQTANPPQRARPLMRLALALLSGHPPLLLLLLRMVAMMALGERIDDATAAATARLLLMVVDGHQPSAAAAAPVAGTAATTTAVAVAAAVAVTAGGSPPPPPPRGTPTRTPLPPSAVAEAATARAAAAAAPLSLHCAHPAARLRLSLLLPRVSIGRRAGPKRRACSRCRRRSTRWQRCARARYHQHRQSGIWEEV